MFDFIFTPMKSQGICISEQKLKTPEKLTLIVYGDKTLDTLCTLMEI